MHSVHSLLLLVLPFSLLLAGCSDDDASRPNGPPVILDIQTDITHWHTHYVSSQEDLQARLTFTVSALVDDPGTVRDLSAMYIRNTHSGRSWYLIGGSRQVPWYANYDLARGVFEYRSFDPDHLDSLTLNGWELVVQDWQGHEVRQAFNFALPNGQPADDGARVVSSEFASPTLADIPALEAMGRSANGMRVQRDVGSASFNIAFTANDSRAVNYLIDFYSAHPGRRFVGYASKYRSASMARMALTPGSEMRLALPWSEIQFVAGYSADDIAAMRVTLLNEEQPLSYLPGVYWMSYLGVSELVPVE